MQKNEAYCRRLSQVEDGFEQCVAWQLCTMGERLFAALKEAKKKVANGAIFRECMGLFVLSHCVLIL
jgi:hypothetical protein